MRYVEVPWDEAPDRYALADTVRAASRRLGLSTWVHLRFARPLGEGHVVYESDAPVLGWVEGQPGDAGMWRTRPTVWLVAGKADRLTAAHEVRHLWQRAEGWAHDPERWARREYDADAWAAGFLGVTLRISDPVPPPRRTRAVRPDVLAASGAGLPPSVRQRVAGLIADGLEVRTSASYATGPDVARRVVAMLEGRDWTAMDATSLRLLGELRRVAHEVAST